MLKKLTCLILGHWKTHPAIMRIWTPKMWEKEKDEMEKKDWFCLRCKKVLTKTLKL